MASLDQVRQYLAYWFQLGKPLIVPAHVVPAHIVPVQGNRAAPAIADSVCRGIDGNGSQNGANSHGSFKFLPQSVIQGDRYSPEFEAGWQQIVSGAWNAAYLEGTAQTIEQLLSSQWDISSCARCTMPVPMLSLGVQMGDTDCPCADLPGWPNTNLPQPREPINAHNGLTRIRDRLSSN